MAITNRTHSLQLGWILGITMFGGGVWQSLVKGCMVKQDWKSKKKKALQGLSHHALHEPTCPFLQICIIGQFWVIVTQTVLKGESWLMMDVSTRLSSPSHQGDAFLFYQNSQQTTSHAFLHNRICSLQMTWCFLSLWAVFWGFAFVIQW